MSDSPSATVENQPIRQEWQGFDSMPSVLVMMDQGMKLYRIAEHFGISRQWLRVQIRTYLAQQKDQDHADSARPFDPSASREP